MKKEQTPKSAMRKTLNLIYAIFALMILVGVLLGPTTPPSRYRQTLQSACMQTSRTIGLCLSQYSLDHNGLYPEGQTSTEVFQHLIDEKYVSDASIFYVKMPGKVRPQSDRLKAENVCWDITRGIDSSASDELPVVFLTGFKITYEPKAMAVPIPPPPAKTWVQSQGWYRTFFGVPNNTFIAVCYKDTSARAIRADENGSIPNFIPTDFDPKGKTYRQLTP